MSYSVNNVLRFDITFRDTRFGAAKFKNVLNFRAIAGEIPNESAAALVATFGETYLSRMLTNLCTTTYLQSIKLTNLTQLTNPEELKVWDAEEVAGTLAINSADVPQAAACVTKKTHARGRKYIGRYFHGPLPARYTNKGELTVDPIAFGDLQDVADALGDPFVNQGLSLRPVVCNNLGTGVDPRNEIRKCELANLIVYLKSRRPGIGE